FTSSNSCRRPAISAVSCLRVYSMLRLHMQKMALCYSPMRPLFAARAAASAQLSTLYHVSRQFSAPRHVERIGGTGVESWTFCQIPSFLCGFGGFGRLQ